MTFTNLALAADERITAQEITLHLTASLEFVVALLETILESDVASDLVFMFDLLSDLRSRNADLATQIILQTARVMVLTNGGAEAKRPEEAQGKAKTWALVASIVALIAIILVSIVLIVFTVGENGSQPLLSLIAAGESISCFARRAEIETKLPLAARFASAVSQMTDALRTFASATRQDENAAHQALTTIHQAIQKLERVTLATASLRGSCVGDPHAIYDCCRQMNPLLANLRGILDTAQLLQTNERQAALRAVQAAQSALRKLRPPRAPKSSSTAR
jgi:hypothetical protein